MTVELAPRVTRVRLPRISRIHFPGHPEHKIEVLTGSILVVIDSSPASFNTLELVCLAADKKSNLHLAHIMPVRLALPKDSTLPPEEEQVLKRAEDFVRAKGFDNVSSYLIPSREAPGSVAEEIAKKAKELNCNVIVAGSDNKDELGRGGINPVVEALLERAHCTVLMRTRLA